MNWGEILKQSSLSGFISGSFAICTTFLVEKLGGKIGGVIATTPLTFIPASYSYLTVTTDEVSQSSLAFVSFGGLADIFFLYIWRLLPHYLPKKYSRIKGMIILIIISILIWILSATIIALLYRLIEGRLSYGLLTWIGFALHLITSIGFSYNSVPSKKGKNKVGIFTHLFRGLFAFTTIFISGILVRTGQGLIGSIAAISPAILTTTVMSMWISQGEDVMHGVTGPLCIGKVSWSGYSSLIILSSYIFYITPIYSILFCILTTILFIGIPIAFYLTWRQNIYINNHILLQNYDNINIDNNIDDNNKNNKDNNNNNNKEFFGPNIENTIISIAAYNNNKYNNNNYIPLSEL